MNGNALVVSEYLRTAERRQGSAADGQCLTGPVGRLAEDCCTSRETGKYRDALAAIQVDSEVQGVLDDCWVSHNGKHCVVIGLDNLDES